MSRPPTPGQALCFFSPESLLDRAKVLLPGALWVANPPPEKLPELEERLGAGVHPRDVLEGGEEIRIRSLVRVSGVQQEETLVLDYLREGEALRRELEFSAPSERDALTRGLEEQLPGWRREETRDSPLWGAASPLAWALVFSGTTASLALRAANPAAGPRIRPRPGQWELLGRRLLEFLGPLGVTALGAVLVGACLVWARRSYQDPSLRWSLLPPT